MSCVSRTNAIMTDSVLSVLFLALVVPISKCWLGMSNHQSDATLNRPVRLLTLLVSLNVHIQVRRNKEGAVSSIRDQNCICFGKQVSSKPMKIVVMWEISQLRPCMSFSRTNLRMSVYTWIIPFRLNRPNEQ